MNIIQSEYVMNMLGIATDGLAVPSDDAGDPTMNPADRLMLIAHRGVTEGVPEDEVKWSGASISMLRTNIGNPIILLNICSSIYITIGR